MAASAWPAATAAWSTPPPRARPSCPARPGSLHPRGRRGLVPGAGLQGRVRGRPAARRGELRRRPGVPSRPAADHRRSTRPPAAGARSRSPAASRCRCSALLRHGKVLRGTPLDPFGWQADRRSERGAAARNTRPTCARSCPRCDPTRSTARLSSPGCRSRSAASARSRLQRSRRRSRAGPRCCERIRAPAGGTARSPRSRTAPRRNAPCSTPPTRTHLIIETARRFAQERLAPTAAAREKAGRDRARDHPRARRDGLPRRHQQRRMGRQRDPLRDLRPGDRGARRRRRLGLHAGQRA